jgi:hypothetical protein
MLAGPFDRFIGVDWSGAASRSGQHIYVAEAHRQDARITLHSVVRARDRQAVESWLRGAPLEHAPAWREWPGPGALDHRARRVVALDFAFGFPSAFRLPAVRDDPASRPPWEDGHWSWPELSRWAASLDEANGSAQGTLASIRTAIAQSPALARQFRLGPGSQAGMHLRLCDEQARGRPTSVFHLIGPSQVGIGSIAGIAMLHRLRSAEHLAVWPFDPPERLARAAAVLVEVFPRMWLEPGLKKNELPDRVRQLEAWQREGVAFRTNVELAAASSGDALDAAAAAIGSARSCYRLPSPEALPERARRREGWIAGVQVPG